MSPWLHSALIEWDIVGMNHYHVDGRRYLFVAMSKDGRLIKCEGPESISYLIWDSLVEQAQRE